eukprot:SAG31_NODE_48131_length_199_cov_11.540000_1_plen_40_part_10
MIHFWVFLSVYELCVYVIDINIIITILICIYTYENKHTNI